MAQYRGTADPETGGTFTVKRYSSEKVPDGSGSWRHKSIVLSPLNPDYKPIVLNEQDADDLKVVAEFVGVLGRSL